MSFSLNGLALVATTKRAMTDLKDCPFCPPDESDPEVVAQDLDYEAYLVQCHSCQCQGPLAFHGCRDPEEDGPIDLEAEAAEMWNKRGGES